MLKKIFFFFFFLALLAVLALWGAAHWLVVLNPGEEVAIENIQSILGKESPVFYSDGVSPLGVFFADAHRQYVTFDQIPKTFVNAIVASEDNRYFQHYGFDLPSIVRAAITNYKAGRVVQGGSTLTQQTAKNLFKRSGRSYEAKLKELLYALRLEHHYSKEQILEFYANQFYVRGNGHGLGVAARYYFDKKVEELTLLESVFIAGSVKRPNYYNPFIRKSGSSKEEVYRRVKIRMGYVLKQMRHLGMLTEMQYQKALAEDVVFNEGQVGYALDYVMEMVRDAVETAEVKNVLEEHGISNLATAGLRVITSVDKGLQEDTLYGLRHELSRLDIRLRGYEREEVQEELKQNDYRGDTEVKEGAFLFGTISAVEVVAGAEQESLRYLIDFGEDLGHGNIDREGLNRPLQALVRWKKNRWSKAKDSDLSLLTKQLQLGDRVWVSVREVKAEGEVFLDLERFPKVQGGALIMQDGMIKAMVGGVENRFFNRAVAARRTMGSAFKPFVYAAALQLGWNSADLLNNSRDVFTFQGQAYYPRPDHKSPHREVSMSWAGVHSENLASVWLLYHLCDHLSVEGFKQVAEKTEMAPRIREGKKEPYNLYRARIRDKHGIVLNKAALREAAYSQAVRHMETDFIFENMAEEYPVLRSLHYGEDFDQHREDLKNALKDKKLTERERQELRYRKGLLKGSYLSLVQCQQEFKAFRRSFALAYNDPFAVPQKDYNGALYFDEERNRYSFITGTREMDGLSPVNTDRLLSYLATETAAGRSRFWGNILLNSTMSSAALALVEKHVKTEYDRLAALPPYSLEVLSAVPDFRIMVGLRYLIALGREAGIASRLDPVLSFPLGSNVVSLLEAVRMYESMVTGRVALAEAENAGNRDLLTVLDRIETIEGDVVYRADNRKKQLFAPETSLALNHVLENIVKFGTGRYAQENARLPAADDGDELDQAATDLVIPLLGKTGTANNYTNASFLGYLPGVSLDGTGMVTEDGYALGVYVGFDNNSPMRKSGTRITGSQGALPTWTEMVNSLLREESYAQKFDPVDLSFYGLNLLYDEIGQVNLEVRKDSGGKVGGSAVEVDEKNRSTQSIMTFGEHFESGRFKAKRYYAPFWSVGEKIIESDL